MASYRLHYFPDRNSYELALMRSKFSSGVDRFLRRPHPRWRNTVNAMGEIALFQEDGVRLNQTAPILLKLAEKYGRFGAAGKEEQFELLRWLFWNNHKLSGDMAPYRFTRAASG